jgi:hypothetical protein
LGVLILTKVAAIFEEERTAPFSSKTARAGNETK